MPRTNTALQSDERSPIDLYPLDIWSIARRRTIHGHRTYHAHAVDSPSIPARVAALHALTTRILAPHQSLPAASRPRIVIVWSTHARATAALPALRRAYGAALNLEPYPTAPFLDGAQPIVSTHPDALCEAGRLPVDPFIVFAELPADADADDAMMVWGDVVRYAGRAGEASQVFMLLDAESEGDRRLAPLLRESMRHEGVEVPELVARIAERGIPDPVDSDMSAEEGEGGEGEEDEGEEGGGVGEEGGVLL